MSSNPRRRPPARRPARADPDARPAPRRRAKAPPRDAASQDVRLQKVLAAAGVASRRASEELIRQGRVTVDGRVARILGTRVNPDRARIEVDGRRIAVRPGHDYYVLNKPPGYVTTVSDPRGRPTVMDLVRSRRRIFPIGRLDADTAGVLLLTDDGELAHRLAHPRFQVPRVYVAEVIGLPGKAVRERLEKGVQLQDGLARAQRVRVRARGSRASQVEVTMSEGRKHEVRLMLEAVGHPVTRLARISYGPIRLAGLPLGAVRALTPREVGDLQVLVGL